MKRINVIVAQPEYCNCLLQVLGIFFVSKKIQNTDRGNPCTTAEIDSVIWQTLAGIYANGAWHQRSPLPRFHSDACVFVGR